MRTLFHRLSARLALTAAAAAFLVIGLAHLAGVGPPPWLMLALPAGTGLAVYVAGVRLLGRRIDRLLSMLEHIRRHEFDAIERPTLPLIDELQAVTWKTYRTGQSVEKEIRNLRSMEHYRREYLGDVSHELKTPIFAIQGFAETLLDGALDDVHVRRSFVDKILRNAKRLSNLASDLSEIARIESGELKMTPEAFDLRQLVHEVLESLEVAAAAKNIPLHYQVPPGIPPAFGDRERIRQVLSNLVDNGIKYNNPGGFVEVVARQLPGGDLKISVVDNGIGIAPEDIARVTERFYRVDKSRSRIQGGTGLGLAIVKHILAAHDRRLVIESTPGAGTTFGFTLPTMPPPRGE